MKTYRVLSLSFILAACGSSNPSNPDIDAGDDPDAPPPISLDAATPDAEPAPVCAQRAPGTIGGECNPNLPCEAPADGSGGLFMFCLNDVAGSTPWPAEGFCTAFFCSTDADCGAGSVCGGLPDGNGGVFTACMPECCDDVGEGMACSEGRMCARSLFGDDLGALACIPGDPIAADGDRCESFADCDVNSICYTDPFQFPEGQCQTLACRGDADCSDNGDGRCELLPDAPARSCVDACFTDSDCRHFEGYRCLDRGDGSGAHCQRPQPGDPCGSQLDCGRDGEAWRCRLGQDYPDGYCTVEACDINENETCPLNSFCVQLDTEADTFCADRCQTLGGSECGAGFDCVEIVPPDGGGSSRNVCIPSARSVVAPLAN